MKVKRSERLLDMIHYLQSRPNELVPLNYFSEKFQAAKSSISEDLTILKNFFEKEGTGTLHTVAGASGGVKYIVKMNDEQAKKIIQELCEYIAKPDRLLPGGYLYMADIVGNPRIMNNVGKLFATKYANHKIDAVMTVATKGIPLAFSTASYLNVPVVIVRRDSKVTEGSTVSINYVSGSSKRIQSMVLAKKSLKEGSNVLIVDDFMKAGGTINGMINLLEEFNAKTAGIAVLVEAEKTEERLVDNYISLVRLSDVDMKEKQIQVYEGNYFSL